uniref:E3 ubiquitin-protein ligase RIN2-like n=1 Tax=Tanacetum cinerariifolium TaxID=118510 RepID=A0A6L2LGN8_TANCI|nr:E3 ubiquitin-protein ligase RIN2-like [Tanacetum cinerariifolium]
MGVGYLTISAVCTVFSFIGVQYGTELSYMKLMSDGLMGENLLQPGVATRVLELLLGSYTTSALVVNFVLNIFILIILSLKTIFFVELHATESRKLVERLVNYVIYKGTFIPLVIPPTKVQAGLWSAWLTVLCSLKMFQALARDRLERLNASPSATPLTYFRVYCVLLLVVTVDAVWIRTCLLIYQAVPISSSSMFLLLFFEPLSIAFETLQAILVHGFQLLDIWVHHSAGNVTDSKISKLLDMSAAGSLWEWKSVILRNVGFFLDIMTLLMALGHYVHIWRLHGMTFHLVDAVLFLNIRALLSAVAKRTRGFIKLRIALGTLHGALPDATSEEIQTYDDECAICREPMAKAKKLSCNHLFHLSCLRSWLDQGLSDNYSCPTCRKPLFVGTPNVNAVPNSGDVSSDEQLARQLSSRLEQQNVPGHTLPTGVIPNQIPTTSERDDWRGSGPESGWLGLDGAGPSTGIRSVGLGRVQMMMRHLAAVGETYAQTALEDASWNLWPINSSQASTSTSNNPSTSTVRHRGGHGGGGSDGGSLIRTAPRVSDDDLAHILAMAETVREVLPHVPDELILRDLQRTNSVSITVNNLLQIDCFSLVGSDDQNVDICLKKEMVFQVVYTPYLQDTELSSIPEKKKRIQRKGVRESPIFCQPRFAVDESSQIHLWEDGNIGKDLRSGRRSCWQTIVNEARVLKNQGIDFFEFLKLKVGDGCTILFWKDRRCEAGILKDLFPRIYALETCKDVNIRTKLEASSLETSLRRNVRGRAEQAQLIAVSEVSEWLDWLASLRHPIKLKALLEGVFYITWWFLWGFRNKILFDSNSPSKAVLFDNIVVSSFTWCKSRCKAAFTWNDWLKNPYLIIV